jgi:hypothetical protein
MASAADHALRAGEMYPLMTSKLTDRSDPDRRQSEAGVPLRRIGAGARSTDMSATFRTPLSGRSSHADGRDGG